MPSRLFVAAVLFSSVLIAPARAEMVPLIRISSENGPTHVQTRILERFVERVAERAGGRLTLELHHGGRLFRDRDVVDALQQGKVEMALPGTWQLDRYDPNVGILLLPMFYGREAADADRLLDGRLGQRLNARITESTGSKVLGRWINLGFAHLYSLDKPIRSYADIAGLRLRSPGGEVNNRRLEALGARALTVSWTELPQAIGNRRIDGLLSTHATVVSARLWEEGLRHAFEDREYFPQYVPLFSSMLWTRLPADLRTVLADAWESLVDEARQDAAEAQTAARRALEAHGVTIVTPDAALLREQRRKLMAFQPLWAEQMGMDPDLVAAFSAALAE